MNFMRSKAGFTLVELIVVIAILAILAGVAVPVYSGYIKKANDAAVVSELAAIKTAADAKAVDAQDTVNEITVTAAGAITVDLTTSTTNVTDLSPYYTVPDNLDDNMGKSATYTSGAKWTAANGWAANS